MKNEPHPASSYAGLYWPPVRVHASGRVRRDRYAGCLGAGVAAIVVGLVYWIGLILLACFCSGCGGVPAETYGATARDVAAANSGAAIGFSGVGANAPAVVAGIVRGAGFLNGLGAFAILGGSVILSHPKLPNEIGFGLVAGGFALVTAGYLLPLYAGYVGLVLLAAVVALVMGKIDWSALVARVKDFIGKFKTSTTPATPVS